MNQSIGLLMVEEGLLSAESLERALVRKEREGGSLALNLVLEGAIDEQSLASFYASRYSLSQVGEDTLDEVNADTFALVPLEIIYDSGILPLALQDETHLAVGLVDPTDRGLIAEATFFSGYTLVQHLITVSQMARYFAMLSGNPWRIGSAEAEALSRAAKPADNKAAADSLLEQTVALEDRLESALEASLDEVYHPNQPLEIAPEHQAEADAAANSPDLRTSGAFFIADRAAEGVSRIQIEAPPAPGPRPPALVVGVDQFQQEHGQTAEHDAIHETDVQPANPFVRVDITQQMAANISLGDGQESPATLIPRVLEGEADTDTGKMKVLGINLDLTSKSDDFETIQPVIETRQRAFGHRPKTAVPSIARRRKGLDISKNCYLLTLLSKNLGPEDADAVSAVRDLSTRLGEVRGRDELGDAIIDGLSSVYDSVAVMTLNGPRAVVWRCATGDEEATNKAVGQTVELESGGVFHRIAENRQFFLGPLPLESPVRDVLDNHHIHDVLVAPVELRGKTILLLYLDGGKKMPSPGTAIEHLLVDIAKGLERVILLRKRGRRK